MNKVISYTALGSIFLTLLIATTPFIALWTNSGPARLWPAPISIVLLLFSFFLWHKAFMGTKSSRLHFAMSLNFLALIFVSVSWIGMPFIDFIFLIIGNFALVFFIISTVLGLKSRFNKNIKEV